jgi:hypothetical protein
MAACSSHRTLPSGFSSDRRRGRSDIGQATLRLSSLLRGILPTRQSRLTILPFFHLIIRMLTVSVRGRFPSASAVPTWAKPATPSPLPPPNASSPNRPLRFSALLLPPPPPRHSLPSQPPRSPGSLSPTSPCRPPDPSQAGVIKMAHGSASEE